MAATYLTKTNSGTGSETKGTFSAWIKILGLGDDNTIFHEYESSGNYISIKLKSGAIQVYGQNNSSAFVNVKTTRVLKDIASWYNIVVAFDSTQSTASNRVKIYINGVQETTLSSTTYPGSSANCKINQNNEQQTIGGARNAEYFIGLMSHVHWVDGTAYSGSDFGSTDSTTGEWQINTSPSVTYGTNGFFILKDGNTITDSSSNSNNFTVGGGTLTKTEDCPSNVFPTFNNIVRQSSIGNLNLDQGNLYSGGNGANAWRSAFMTLAAKTGKYYCEMKCVGTDGSSQNFGISDVQQFNTGTASGFDFASVSRGYGLNPNGNKVNNGGAVNVSATYTTNDIVMMAYDLDNGKIYFGKNGTWYSSGDPTSGSTGTGSFFNIATGYFYSPTVAIYGAADNMALNFGNGYIRTTPVSSAGTNASGNGIFEYNVPTGYTALSTKGLNL